MKYTDIKEFTQRCEEHPDHQNGMISHGMIQQRLSEEIDELREYIEQRTWVGLSVFEINDLVENTEYEDYCDLVERTEAKLKEKNFS